MNLHPVAKAVVGAVVAALGALYTALTDDVVTPQEAVGVAIVFVATGGGVWRVPNRPAG